MDSACLPRWHTDAPVIMFGGNALCFWVTGLYGDNVRDAETVGTQGPASQGRMEGETDATPSPPPTKSPGSSGGRWGPTTCQREFEASFSKVQLTKRFDPSLVPFPREN